MHWSLWVLLIAVIGMVGTAAILYVASKFAEIDFSDELEP